LESADINLNNWLGGDLFKVPYKLHINGLGINTNTLLDSEAMGYEFIDYKFAKRAKTFLGDHL
jgi:hypothetical protein